MGARPSPEPDNPARPSFNIHHWPAGPSQPATPRLSRHFSPVACILPPRVSLVPSPLISYPLPPWPKASSAVGLYPPCPPFSCHCSISTFPTAHPSVTLPSAPGDCKPLEGRGLCPGLSYMLSNQWVQSKCPEPASPTSPSAPSSPKPALLAPGPALALTWLCSSMGWVPFPAAPQLWSVSGWVGNEIAVSGVGGGSCSHSLRQTHSSVRLIGPEWRHKRPPMDPLRLVIKLQAFVLLSVAFPPAPLPAAWAPPTPPSPPSLGVSPHTLKDPGQGPLWQMGAEATKLPIRAGLHALALGWSQLRLASE